MSLIPMALVLAFSGANFIWNFLGVILVLICLFLIVIILMQDSKGAGLTSAFGAGPGGESLLGARMQKDVARWTAYLSLAFGIIVIIMGLLGNYILRYGTAGVAGAKAPTAQAPAEAPDAKGSPPGPEILFPPGPSAPGTQGAAAPVPPAIPPSGSASGAPQIPVPATPAVPAPTGSPAPVPPPAPGTGTK